MKKFSILTVVILHSLFVNSQTVINPYFWSQNYWVPVFIDPYLPKAAEAGVTLMRYGGISPNVGTPSTPPVTIGEMIKFIDEARANGIEPVLQIPYKPDEIFNHDPADIETKIIGLQMLVNWFMR